MVSEQIREKKISYPLRLDEGLYRAVEAAARERGWPVSIWVRETLKAAVSNETSS